MLKMYENVKYDDLVPCIEFLNTRGVELADVKRHDRFCNLISFLSSITENDKTNSTKSKCMISGKIYSQSSINIAVFSELIKICEFYFWVSAHNADAQ